MVVVVGPNCTSVSELLLVYFYQHVSDFRFAFQRLKKLKQTKRKSSKCLNVIYVTQRTEKINLCFKTLFYIYFSQFLHFILYLFEK